PTLRPAMTPFMTKEGEESASGYGIESSFGEQSVGGGASRKRYMMTPLLTTAAAGDATVGPASRSAAHHDHIRRPGPRSERPRGQALPPAIVDPSCDPPVQRWIRLPPSSSGL